VATCGVPTQAHATVGEALAAARAAAGADATVVACGSFLTVAAALEHERG
jgi:folylpolyglutamate synthase/dihydropteroate synthase